MAHIDHCANVLGATLVALGDRLDGPSTASGDAALVALSEYLSGATIGTLQTVVGLSHSGCVRLVDRLVADGLARREHASDGRSVALAPTAAGLARAREIQLRRLRMLAGALDVLDDAERVAFGELCGKLLAGLRRSGSSPHAICRLCDPHVCGHPDRCPVTLAGATSA